MKKKNEKKRNTKKQKRKTKIIKSKDTASIKKLRERDERKQVHRPKTTTDAAAAAMAVGLFGRSSGKSGAPGGVEGRSTGTRHTQAERRPLDLWATRKKCVFILMNLQRVKN